MGGAASRRKGSTLERDVVNAAKALGLDAVRSAPMQGVGRSGGADVTINGILTIECKSHRRISGWPQIITSMLLNTDCPLTKEQQSWLDGQAALCLKLTGWPEPIIILARREGGFKATTLTVWLQAVKDTEGDQTNG